MRVLRTAEERFAGLPDFGYEPRYADVGGLRLAYVEAGPPAGQPVLLLHGEPSWSFLYRKVIPVLAGAGLRAIAPDLIGFGRSDKPAEVADHTYARHVEWIRALAFDALGLSGVTLVGQDWGGLIGLRLVAEHPGRFARVVAANTFLPTGDTNPGDAFFAWQKFSQEVDVFPTGGIVRGGCAKPVAPEVEAAYDAPFPDESYKSGARQFPLLVPSRPDDPAHDANVAAWVGLAAFDRPFLCAFSDSDPITKGADRNLKERIAGAQGQPHTTIVGGGHFLQEDCGEDLARVVASFVAANP